MKDYIEGKLGGGKVSILSGMSPLIKFIVVVVFNALLAVTCGFGFIFAAAVDSAIEDVTGVATTMLGTTIAFISFILALFSVVTSGVPDMVLAVTLCLLGILLSGIGFLLTLISALKPIPNSAPNLRTNIIVSEIWNIFTILVGLWVLHITQMDP
jgi:hypothetical protein